MKKLFCLLLVFAMAIPAFAEIKVTGHAPTVKGPGADQFNTETQTAFAKALTELNDQLKLFKNSARFLEAMGDSSVYASHGATTRGYGGYKLFSATVGSIIGVQIPNEISTLMDDFDGLADSLEKQGDIKLGVSPNVFNANIGLSMGIMKFLPEHLGIINRNNLYIGFRIGYFNLPEIGLGEGSKLNYNNLTLGLTANYQIIPSISLAGLIVWRGVNLGSGIIYNRSKMDFGISVDKEISQPIGNTGTEIALHDPKASVNLSTSTVTIPLEAITAVKLLVFNIPLGIGADLAFGSTSLGAGVDAKIGYNNLPSIYNKDKEGDIAAVGDLSSSPHFFNFKIMTGFGFTAGPFVLDIPITWYPSGGYNFGVTIGIVF